LGVLTPSSITLLLASRWFEHALIIIASSHMTILLKRPCKCILIINSFIIPSANFVLPRQTLQDVVLAGHRVGLLWERGWWMRKQKASQALQQDQTPNFHVRHLLSQAVSENE